MSERFGGGSMYGDRYQQWLEAQQSPGYSAQEVGVVHFFEQIPPQELNDVLKQIDVALAQLIEASGDLTSQQKQFRRGHLQQLLATIGISDMSQFAKVYQNLHQKMQDVPMPSDYPSEQQFSAGLSEFMRRKGSDAMITSNPDAADVAAHGWVRDSLSPRGSSSVTIYLYNLGKVVRSEFHYAKIFTVNDSIALRADGLVENGQHRAAILGSFGSAGVRRNNLSSFIPVVKR